MVTRCLIRLEPLIAKKHVFCKSKQLGQAGVMPFVENWQSVGVSSARSQRDLWAEGKRLIQPHNKARSHTAELHTVHHYHHYHCTKVCLWLAASLVCGAQQVYAIAWLLNVSGLIGQPCNLEWPD